MSIESRFFDYDVEPDASRVIRPPIAEPSRTGHASRARFAIGMTVAAVLVAGGSAFYMAADDRTPVIALGR